jgi:hypothetical protein
MPISQTHCNETAIRAYGSAEYLFLGQFGLPTMTEVAKGASVSSLLFGVEHFSLLRGLKNFD